MLYRYRDLNRENTLPNNATEVINETVKATEEIKRKKMEEMEKRKVARGRQSGEGSNDAWYLWQIREHVPSLIFTFHESCIINFINRLDC
jgi:hypothetical protein